ncbi:HNH endonuclease [Pseudomonas monteilii]|uniref:HNH endonuclease n=1 Tax=Pseudomonas monteilii TaxID=76759 RepID=UPI0018D9DECD|nr:HNH endonuclease [Pseudomonas monteilii]MBH3393393.1 HNH endonuclease [Pseudomonas monteilii]
MSKAYQEIITELIDRIYLKKRTSDTTRIILKKYFTQKSSRRKLTLEMLGKLPDLEREVSRERARQVISKFVDKDLPTELRRLERGLAAGDDVTLNEKSDLVQLKDLLEIVTGKIRAANKPVFARRVQDELMMVGVIDDNIYLPIAVQLARSFGMGADFKFQEFNGHHIILESNHDPAAATKDILQYARKISTYFGGLFSLKGLLDPSLREVAPEFISKIPGDSIVDYISDLISSEHDYLAVSSGRFYAFTSRDERISRILKPVFFHYQNPLRVERVIPAIKRALTNNFRRNADERQNICLELLDSADNAIDDYCLKTGLLQESAPGYRIAGPKLTSELPSFEPGDTIRYQEIALNSIRLNGAPLDSMSLGRELRGKVPEAYKPIIFTYPTLYYKEGGGRRNDHYKPLDDSYIFDGDLVIPSNPNLERIAYIKRKITDLIVELESLDVQTGVIGKARMEQTMLREYLLLRQNSLLEDYESAIGSCEICGKVWPHSFLIAAHVKPRAKCTHEERGDIDNIAMLQCVTCDSLFENGLITIHSNGLVAVNRDKTMTKDLAQLYASIEGRRAYYLNGNENRLLYLQYHWLNIFNG